MPHDFLVSVRVFRIMLEIEIATATESVLLACTFQPDLRLLCALTADASDPGYCCMTIPSSVSIVDTQNDMFLSHQHIIPSVLQKNP